MSSAPLLLEAVADWTFGIGVVVAFDVVAFVAVLVDVVFDEAAFDEAEFDEVEAFKLQDAVLLESLLLLVLLLLLRGFRFVTDAVCCCEAAVLVLELVADVFESDFLLLVVEQEPVEQDDLLLPVVEQHVLLGDVVEVDDVVDAVFVLGADHMFELLPVVFVFDVLAVEFVDVKGVRPLRLFVKVSKLAIGENMRRVFSNIDMFCLLISSSVVPKGKMLPNVVWK